MVLGLVLKSIVRIYAALHLYTHQLVEVEAQELPSISDACSPRMALKDGCFV